MRAITMTRSRIVTVFFCARLSVICSTMLGLKQGQYIISITQNTKAHHRYDHTDLHVNIYALWKEIDSI